MEVFLNSEYNSTAPVESDLGTLMIAKLFQTAVVAKFSGICQLLLHVLVALNREVLSVPWNL